MESVWRVQLATYLYLPFEIKRISFAYLVAFMLKIIMMTWTSWQMTATAYKFYSHTHSMSSSPLCTCNCLFSFFFWFRLIFIIFPLHLYCIEAGWKMAQHSTNKQTSKQPIEDASDALISMNNACSLLVCSGI